jgi:hypothetical protein
LLKALYRLNPVVGTDGQFNVTHDFPRMEVEDYRHAVELEERKVAVPITAGYSLDSKEIAKIEGLFGPQCVKKGAELTLSKDYNNERLFTLPANDANALAHTLSSKLDFLNPSGAQSRTSHVQQTPFWQRLRVRNRLKR